MMPHIINLQGLSLKAQKTFVFILVSALLIFFIYPSAFIYSKDTLPDNNDTRLIAYIIGQVQQNILKGQPLHYGTFFAPDQNTLAYSDLFLTSAILSLPFRLFTTHPIIIFNIALVLGFILTSLSSFFLFEYMFKDFWIATLATLLFNFSGFHLHYFPHLQIFSLWPFILSLYLFLRYQTENRLLLLNLFFLTVTAQLAESIFPAYLILFSVTIIIVVKHQPSRTLLEGQTFTKIFLRSLPFIPLWFFLLYPYYHLHTSLPEATRPIRDAAHFSLGLDQIFTQYHSWTIIILLLISVVVRIFYNKAKIIDVTGALAKKRTDNAPVLGAREYGFWRGPKRIIFEIKKLVTTISDQSVWQIIFWFALIMSLGPVLKIFGTNIRIFGFPIPLPYSLFYYLFPGFTGFRTPSRFIVLALLAAVIIIGYNLQPIFAKLKSKTKFIFILLVLTLLFWEADLPLKGYPVNINMHPVYQEVKKLPTTAVILELPIKLWNMPDHEIESIRSLYTLDHQHRRFGGFSGFATNHWINLVEKINASGLNTENISQLKSLGITHIVENNLLLPL